MGVSNFCKTPRQWSQFYNDWVWGGFILPYTICGGVRSKNIYPYIEAALKGLPTARVELAAGYRL